MSELGNVRPPEGFGWIFVGLSLGILLLLVIIGIITNWIIPGCLFLIIVGILIYGEMNNKWSERRRIKEFEIDKIEKRIIFLEDKLKPLRQSNLPKRKTVDNVELHTFISRKRFIGISCYDRLLEEQKAYPLWLIHNNKFRKLMVIEQSLAKELDVRQAWEEVKMIRRKA